MTTSDGEDSDLPFFCVWDGYGLDQPGSGIYSYAALLYRELAALGVHPLVVGAKPSQAPQFAADFLAWRPAWLAAASRFKLLAPHLSMRSLQQLAPRPLNAPLGRPQIFHGLANTNIGFYGRRTANWRSVVTIHDVIPLLPGSGVSNSYRAQFSFALPRVVAAADRIICVSQWGADSLCEFYPSAASKLVVIRNGVPPLSRAERGASPCRQEEAGPLRLLCVARHEPYKRLDLLIEVLAGFSPDTVSLSLVSDARGVRHLGQSAARLVARGQLQLNSGLSQLELQAEYRRAELYLQPSRYEGYGLPAVEALAHRVPVIYQSGNAADEVVGRRVGLPMPAAADASAWREAILSWRQHKYSEAFRQALEEHSEGAPSWQCAAQALKSVYNSLS